MGDQRLRARLRRLPPARRALGRPARAPARLHGRPGHLHARLAPLRARLERGVADRRPRAPGARRGDDHAGGALDPDRRPSRRAASGTSRSAPGARSAASAPPPASCSAASSPTSSRWEWIFFVNVPVGARRRSSSRRSCSRESRDTHGQDFDVPGAVLVTVGPRRVLVLGITQGERAGAGARARRSASSSRPPCCCSAFVAWESARAGAARAVLDLPAADAAGANIAGFILGTALFSMFLMLTLYMQQVLELLAAEDRRRLPRRRRHGDHLGERRRGRGQPGRRQAR